MDRLVAITVGHPVECPVCDVPTEPLGAVGSLIAHRCGACGMDFLVEGDEEPLDD